MREISKHTEVITVENCFDCGGTHRLEIPAHVTVGDVQQVSYMTPAGTYAARELAVQQHIDMLHGFYCEDPFSQPCRPAGTRRGS